MLSTDELLAILADRRIRGPELGACLGLVPGAIDRVLAGTRRLKLEEAKRIVDTFGLEPAAPVDPLPLDLARRFVLHAADRFCVRPDPDDAQVEELARDLQAFLNFTADPHHRENAAAAETFLSGLGCANETAESGHAAAAAPSA